MRRVRQLISALTAKVSPEEKKWVEEVLSPQLQPLFWEMDNVDQRHCLDVAADAVRMADPKVDKPLLIQAALIHDCGKRDELNIMHRVLIVVITGLLGDRAQRLARQGKKRTLGHSLWLFYNHPRRGANLVKSHGGSNALCKLVEEHHIPPGPHSSPEQVALYRADQQN